MLSPFAFQELGASWLCESRFRLLADEMGLGKTVQVILACEALGLRRILVICPAVARANWAREFAGWWVGGRNASVLYRIADPLPQAFELVVCSFEYATRNQESLKCEWDVLVIDEVHYLKSKDAKRAQAILGNEGIIHGVKRCWALSGTPAPNNASELWLLLFVFGVTRLNYTPFIERYCDLRWTNYGMKVVGTKRSMIPELKELLAQVMLRRRKLDVLTELPPLFFSEYSVTPGEVMLEDLKEEERGGELMTPLYQRLEAQTLILAAALNSQERIAMLEGLAQSVSTLRRYTGLQKIRPVSDLIAGELELGLYGKVVIFAVHTAVIERLAENLKDFGVVLIYGKIPPDKRQQGIERFQADPAVRVFIGNILAAGTNITLTAAHQVVFVEQDWVPGNNAQAAMRCHRIGQIKSVSVRFISLNNAIDERLTRTLRRKTQELSQIFD